MLSNKWRKRSSDSCKAAWAFLRSALVSAWATWSATPPTKASSSSLQEWAPPVCSRHTMPTTRPLRRTAEPSRAPTSLGSR